jgi:hypothetical protein
MLLAHHDHLGHVGTAKMAGLLRSRYYWPKMAADANDHTRQCHECTLAKPSMHRPAAPKGPPVGSYPFDCVFCDVVSTAETADFVSGGAGFDKLLVFVDSLTRWVEATPFNGPPSTENVLDAFMTQIVSRHGVPRQLRSDAGSNFAHALAADIFTRMGTDLTNSEAEHHESVGIVERVQQTLT